MGRSETEWLTSELNFAVLANQVQSDPGAHVLRGHFLHNGQAGMDVNGDVVVIDGAEFAYNNIWSGFNPAWSASCVKFWNVRIFTLRNCTSHHTGGPGLWWDYECDDASAEQNNVYL